MKKLISVILCTALLLTLPFYVCAAEEPETSAEAFVLYCAENGEIILSKNENKRMKPASTTKLMTALITLEEAAKNDRLVTFTPEMTAEGSSMYLKYGEKLRLSDLAAGMMMCSGNDAANAAATAISGSTEKFAGLMNARAKKLGMENTHFVTANGLDDEKHYSTARDLALLMAAGLQNKAFAELTAQKGATVSFAEPEDKTVVYANHNRLLRLYENCIGGKTGYTTAAGRCLVSAARRGGVTLICVTLDDKNDWNDHISLYESGFSRLSGFRAEDSSFVIKLPCVGGAEDEVDVRGEADVSLVTAAGRAKNIQRKIYLDSFVYAPVKKGEKLGRIDYLLDGRVLKSIALIAGEDVEIRKTRINLLRMLKAV